MTDKSIKCPECGTEIEISTVLAQQIEADLKEKNEIKLQKLIAETKNKAQQKFDQEMAAMKARLDEQKQKLEQIRKKEQALNKQRQELEEKREQLDQELEVRLKKQEQILRQQLEEKARQTIALEINDLKEQLKEKDSKIAEAQTKELEIRKKARELEDRQKSLDLELQRKLDEERKGIEESLKKQFSDEIHFKLQEKEKQINDLRKSLEEAKRKSEQGSTETQGEVLELDLEQRLHSTFLHDTISPVPKGIRGADVIQEVRDSSLNPCGKIIWEAKNTKNWSPQWIQKLKDDQREIGANIAILISVTLPEGINRFGLIEGVWVTDIPSSLPLASAIREQLIQIQFARNASMGKNEKMEAIFKYLSGDEFRQRVEAIVETFSGMQEQLNRERRAMERIWKEREKQIQRITTNTISMYSEVRGIIGSSVQPIPALELDALEPSHKLQIPDEKNNG